MLTFDELVAAARRLSPRDQLRLIERLAADLEPAVSAEAPAREAAPAGQTEPVATDENNPGPATQLTPSSSLYGVWKDIVPEISAEEIAEMRREAWKSFPREHFFIEDEE